MALGKLLVPGRPIDLDMSRTRACCACSGCGWGLFGHFFLSYHFSCLSPSLWETARYRLKYCLKGPFSPKQPTNRSIHKNLRRQRFLKTFLMILIMKIMFVVIAYLLESRYVLRHVPEINLKVYEYTAMIFCHFL